MWKQIRCALALAFLLSQGILSRAADLRHFLITKGVALVQTNENPPGLRAAPFEFHCEATLTELGGLYSASIKPPGQSVTNLENWAAAFSLDRQFSSKPALDARFPAGTYNVSVQSVHDGNQNFQVGLGGDAYPPSPQFLNWAALQSVHAESEMILSWLPYSGGTGQDFVQVRIYNDLYEAFRSPDFGQPGALNGTHTSVTVPAEAMFPGEIYTVELLFANVLAVNAGLYPNATVITGYYKTTSATLQTYNPHGVLEFIADTYNVYEHEGYAKVVVNRRGGTEGVVSVYYSTADGTAVGADQEIPGYDYVRASGVLTFAEGERTKTFQVRILDDFTGGSTKGVQLGLSGFEGGASPGLFTSAVLNILDDEAPLGPNVAFYLVAKGQNYVQNGVEAPALDVSNNPFRFVAALEAAFSNSVSAASVLIPGNIFRTMNASLDRLQFDFGAGFATKAAVDAAYPGGGYKFNIATKAEGTKTPLLTLPAEIYPSTPHVANWIEAQEIEAGTEFTLRWDAMGGTSNDFINIAIRDAGGNDLIGSPWLFEPGYLNGLATSWTIPANTLAPGQAYQARVLFVKRAALNITAYPGVTGLAAFYKETIAPIGAAAIPTPQGRLVFASSAFSISEQGGEAAITVKRIGGSSGQVSVAYATSNGSAVAPMDYTATVGTLVFAEGETSRTFVVPVVDDFLLDGNKTLNLSLSNPEGGAVIPNYPFSTLTILDNEIAAAGIIQFSVTNATIAEGAGKASITLTRSSGSSGVVSAALRVAYGSAVINFDYLDPTTTVTFNPGETTRTLVVPIVNDSLDEPNETLMLYLSDTTGGASLGPKRNCLLTITDDDAGGTIQFNSRTVSVNETSPVVNLRVNRTGGIASGVTVDYAAFNGSALNELDYSLSAGKLSFGSNELSKLIVVPITNDILAEGNETFTVVLSNPTGGAVLGGISNSVVTIVDDESSIEFSSSTYTNTEGVATVSLSVQRVGPTATPASVDFATSYGTAGAFDFQAKAGRLNFGPGVARQSISIVVSNDTIVEGMEDFQVTLSNITGALYGPRTNATVYIKDNDLGGAVQFSATNFTAAESLANATITITRSGGVASGVTVDLTTLDGTALEGLDYVNSTQTVSFKANEISKTVLIPLRNDAIDEPNETIKLLLSNAQGGASLGKNTNALLTITDNDVGGTIQFSAASAKVSVNESNGFLQLSVARSGGAAGGVSVDYFAVDGTAQNGQDFNLTHGTLSFASNELTQTISIAIVDNFADHSNKTFRVTLANASGGAVLGAASNAVVTIVDDDIVVDGTYTGKGTASISGCQNPVENGTVNLTWQFVLSQQDGHQFVGTAIGIVSGPASDALHFTLSGSIDSLGNIKGAYERTGAFESSTGSGSFIGKVTGNALQITFSGGRPGETCKESATMSGTKLGTTQSGLSPWNLHGLALKCIPQSTSGVFSTSSFTITVGVQGNSFAIRNPQTDAVESSGTFVYHKTAANTATAAFFDPNEGLSIVLNITLTAPLLGNYTLAGSESAGNQSGALSVMPWIEQQ